MAAKGAVNGQPSKPRRLLSWLALLSLGAVAALLLNGALFSAWMSGGPPNPYPQGWALRSLAFLVWSLAAATGAAALFYAIRRASNLGRTLLIVCAICAALAAAPFLAREVLIDKCLDGGGRWNAGGLVCEPQTSRLGHSSGQ